MQQSLVSLSSLSDDLQQQLVHLNEALGAIGSYRKVDAAKLIQCFDLWFNQKWYGVHSNPRSAPSEHVIVLMSSGLLLSPLLIRTCHSLLLGFLKWWSLGTCWQFDAFEIVCS